MDTTGGTSAADAVDELARALEVVGQALDAPGLAPDPGRTDWADHREALDETRRALQEEVLAVLDEAAASLAAVSKDAEGNLRNNVASITAELAAVLQAAGDSGGAAQLLARALRAGPSGDIEAEITAAAAEPAVYVWLVFGRWQLRTTGFAEGDDTLREHRRDAVDPRLKAAFTKALDGPRPLTGDAPALFRFNGCGAALYGTRDPWPDGSHVATYCVCLLFVPIIALRAYRVIPHGDGAYTFFAKERLSPFARGWNMLLGAAAVLGVAWFAVAGYLDSPGRLTRLALEEAERLEQAGDPGAADAYERVLTEHSSPVADIDQAAEGMVRVLAAAVEAPMTLERVGHAERVVLRCQRLPACTRSRPATAALTGALGGWADQLGTESEAAQRAALSLVELGAGLGAEPGARDGALSARAAAIHVAMGGALREQWPAEALLHYVAAGTPEADEAAAHLVGALGASQYADLSEPLAAWEARVDPDAPARAHLADLRQALADWSRDERRTRALEGGDVEALAILLTERPEDQEVACAIADARRGAGDVEGALEVFAPYGPPGQLSLVAQRALAGCLSDQGRLDEADALLTRQVQAWLPPYRRATQAYEAASSARAEALIAQARSGAASDLEVRLTGVVDEARGAEIAQAWLRERLDADPDLIALRDAYAATSAVVPTALNLGTLKLRRAHAATGAERERLLGDAERLFLSIRQEAEGVPAFHLGLGQVYHRLGRSEDAEAELRGVLEGADGATALAVAATYRELGLIERAREVASGVHGRTDLPPADAARLRGEAAFMMALMTNDLDERERWLERGDGSSPSVQIGRLEVRAERALLDRELAEADRLFELVATRYLDQGASSAAALNNAALAERNRFRCTGDPTHLDTAIERMGRALALMPDNALGVGNLAAIARHRGNLRVLEGFVRTSPLRPDLAQTERLIGWLADASRREQVIEALRRDPDLRRARELHAQEQVLSPQRWSAWANELEWASQLRDVEALRGLRARLERVELDTSYFAEERAQSRADAQSDRWRAQVDAAVEDAARLVEAARRTRHAPTVSAALHLSSAVLGQRAWQQRSAPDAAAAVAAAREGAATWDGFGDGRLAWALMEQALIEAMAEQPELAAAREEHLGVLRPVLIASSAAASSPAVARALGESALLDEAGALLAAEDPEALDLDAVAFAELADDAALRERLTVVRRRPRTQLELELRARIDPEDPRLPLQRPLLRD